ncbi:MAG: EI24 domain-containing protein [Campylobacterota bacterium]|nr:EI24 domain-containing protein [Campylobacterota bacterium]
MNELDIFNKSLKDYFSKDILKIVLYPLLGSLVVLYFLFFTLADMGLDSLENTQIKIQQHEMAVQNGEITDTSVKEELYTGNSFIDFLLQYTITSWIVSFLVYSVGLFAIGYLSIFISLLIIGLLTPKILAIIHKRYYSSIPIESYDTVSEGLVKTIRTVFVMLLLFLALFPFYFIPVVNLIAINIPLFYFFHKMLHYDVSSSIMSRERYLQIYSENKTTMRIKTLLLYLVSLIPFAAFFISVFYIVYLGHTYFLKLSNK